MDCRILKILLRVSAAMAIAACMSCARFASDMPDPEENRALLSISIDAGDVAPMRAPGSRATDDSDPANDGEKMKTLRVIIFSRSNDTENWITEHNRFIDLASAPATLHEWEQFPVAPNSVKKIVLIANERNIKVRTSADGTAVPASDYFQRFSSSAGSYHTDQELSEMQASLLMLLGDNKTDAGMLMTPLAMTAVYDDIPIGDARPEPYTESLTIHRAAVKYTFRITNSDNTFAHTINSISIDNMASSQFFFPHEGSGSYVTPSGDSCKTVELTENKSILPGKTAEFGPYYFPEGHHLSGNDVYHVAFVYDGNHTGWQEVRWASPEESGDQSKLMTDLPRNTHVVVNVNFKFNVFQLNYTRCPWTSHDIDIPDFN